jgi:hypothetical protein
VEYEIVIMKDIVSCENLAKFKLLGTPGINHKCEKIGED